MCIVLQRPHHGLTAEQMRVLSLKKPPLEKLKDIPLSMLKPRPPRHILKEKSLSVPHTKHKVSNDSKTCQGCSSLSFTDKDYVQLW